MRFDGKVSVSVDMVSGVPQGSALKQLLLLLNTSEPFYIVENHMMS